VNDVKLPAAIEVDVIEPDIAVPVLAEFPASIQADALIVLLVNPLLHCLLFRFAFHSPKKARSAQLLISETPSMKTSHTMERTEVGFEQL